MNEILNQNPDQVAMAVRRDQAKSVPIPVVEEVKEEIPDLSPADVSSYMKRGNELVEKGRMSRCSKPTQKSLF